MTRRCRHCGAPAKGTRCARHAAAHRRREADRREALRQAWLCTKCGERPVAKVKLEAKGHHHPHVRELSPPRQNVPDWVQAMRGSRKRRGGRLKRRKPPRDEGAFSASVAFLDRV